MPLSSRVLPLSMAGLACAAAAAAEPAMFAATAYPAVAKPRTIVAADFNRDGRPDIATGGIGGSIAILINDTRTSGGFRRTADIVVGGGPFDLAAGDLNRDGKMDLVIANADSNMVTVLTGRGDGRFNAKRDIAVGGNPRGIALADVNGDGRLDVLVTQYEANTWTVLAGDGAGGTSGATSYRTAARPQGIVAADINRDGRMDVVVANAGRAVLSVFFDAGRDTQTRRDTAVPVTLNVLTTGDFNGDGWLDVAGASIDSDTAIVVRGSAGGLTAPARLASDDSPRGITAIDLNQDGRLDVAMANRGSNTLTVHFGRGDGTFTDTATLSAGRGSRAIAAEDFDRDGRIDLASVNELDSTASVFENVTAFVHAGQTFSAHERGVPPGVSSGGFVALGDFDEDGRPDAIALGSPSPRLFLSRGTQVDLRGDFPTGLAVGDFDGDGHADIVRSDYRQDRLTVELGDGTGSFTEAGTLAIAAPLQLVAGDFNRDGRLDLAVGSLDTLRVLLGRGDGRFTAGAIITQTGITGLATADFDRDGRLDLVTAEYHSAGLRVRYGDGRGSWRTETFLPLSDSPGDVQTADFNGDGRPDLAAPVFSGVAVVLAHRTGFDDAIAYPLPPDLESFPFQLSAGDVDLDGDIDIVTNDSEVLVNTGDGTFTAAGFAGFGAPLIADVTGDGLPDILLAGGGVLTVLVGERSESNRQPTVTAGPDLAVGYQFVGSGDFAITATGSDPDQHDLRYEWRDGAGRLLATTRFFEVANLTNGRHTLTVTAFDGRGGQASDSMRLTVQPYTEIYTHVGIEGVPNGGWRSEENATAAGEARLRHTDAGGAKRAAPLANPADYFEFSFKADPTQAYKLWIRGKADGDSPYNDSVFVQFTGAVNASGTPAWRIGSTDALVFNLEECAGCGLSGWGWEDDGWGAVDQSGGLIRFPEGGWQVMRIQTREDGLSIDQVVLSSGAYLTRRPGAAKNDTTILGDTNVAD